MRLGHPVTKQKLRFGHPSMKYHLLVWPSVVIYPQNYVAWTTIGIKWPNAARRVTMTESPLESSYRARPLPCWMPLTRVSGTCRSTVDMPTVYPDIPRLHSCMHAQSRNMHTQSGHAIQEHWDIPSAYPDPDRQMNRTQPIWCFVILVGIGCFQWDLAIFIIGYSKNVLYWGCMIS